MNIHRDDLRNAINILKPVLSGKSIVPAEGWVIIEDKKMRGATLEMSVSHNLNIEVDEPFALEFSDLVSIADASNSDYLEIWKEGALIKFKSGRRRGSVAAMDLNEAMHYKAMDFDTVPLMSLDLQTHCKNAISFADKKDELRPIRTMVSIYFEDDISIFATDAHKMYLASIKPDNKIEATGWACVSPKGQKVIDQMNGMVKIGGNEKYSYFSDGIIEMICAKPGSDPMPLTSIRSVIPPLSDNPITLNMMEFGKDAELACRFSNGDSKIIIFDGDTVYGEDIDTNKKAVCTIPGANFMRIGIQGSNLSALPSVNEDCDIHVISENKAMQVIWRNVRMLFMPIMLPS